VFRLALALDTTNVYKNTDLHVLKKKL